MHTQSDYLRLTEIYNGLILAGLTTLGLHEMPKGRVKNAVLIRACAFVIMKQMGYTVMSMQAVSKKDRTTALHHIEKHEQNMKYWTEYRDLYNVMREEAKVIYSTELKIERLCELTFSKEA